MSERREWFHYVYELFAYMGIGPDELTLNYDDEDTKNHMFLALPESKVGLAVTGDRTEDLLDDKWVAPLFSLADYKMFAKVFEAIREVSVTHKNSVAEKNMMKTGSSEERLLLGAILRAGLPEPDRNYRVFRANGSELTTPDFTWPRARVAFFMDGLWWHHSRDDTEKLKEIQAIASDPKRSKSMIEASRARASRDSDNRSELVTMGWKVLSCTDEDLANPEGVERQVRRISDLLRASIIEAQQAEPVGAPQETKDDEEFRPLGISDLF